MVTDSDKKQIREHGLTEEQVLQQIQQFKTGIEHLHIARPCTLGDGISHIQEPAYDALIQLFEQAQSDGRVQKFVPASGAATRMFKTLLEILHDPAFSIEKLHKHQDAEKINSFLQSIDQLAFYDELEKYYVAKESSPGELKTKDEILEFLSLLLLDEGLNLSNLPKLLVPFHNYGDYVRTPLWEHLIEAQAYTCSKARVAKLHFTLSNQHEAHFQTHLADILRNLSPDTKFDISYSYQKPSTDTIAVDKDYEPFRLKDGELVFRPGGHGALIENINDLQGDVIFIKNVDNILPDPQKDEEIRYKKILGGFLLGKEKEIFAILTAIDRDPNDNQNIVRGFNFIENQLQIPIADEIQNSGNEKKVDYIMDVLNRPIRVCGMVRNEGEPGGGPFWVEGQQRYISKQIVEQVQINTKEPGQHALLQNATHFNPVDLVCSVRNFRSESFNLLEFVDPKTGFISHKSVEGRELLALELPGLWNGAMAFWTTFFVEMPISTFNPVKTIFDLMRPQHVVQNENTNFEKG